MKGFAQFRRHQGWPEMIPRFVILSQLRRPKGRRAPAKNPSKTKSGNQAHFVSRGSGGFFGTFGWLRHPHSPRMTDHAPRQRCHATHLSFRATLCLELRQRFPAARNSNASGFSDARNPLWIPLPEFWKPEFSFCGQRDFSSPYGLVEMTEEAC